MKVTIKALPLAILTLVILFGGMVLAAQLGLWQTGYGNSGGGSGDGGRNRQISGADDIRGSMYLADICSQLGILPEDIATAFNLPADQMDVLRAKDLELFVDPSAGEFEGVASLRIFAACYLGSPTQSLDAGILPKSAILVLLENGKPTADQLNWLTASLSE